MDAFSANEGENAGRPCSNVVDAAYGLPLWSMFILSGAWSLGVHRRRRIVTRKDAAAAVGDALLTMVFVFVMFFVTSGSVIAMWAIV